MGFLRNLGTPELLIILAVVLLIFGSSRLPSLARSIGKSAKELRAGLTEGGVDEDSEPDEGETEEPVS